jgi:ribosomal protein S18 acetylase RimI-like enzyme
MTTNTQDAYESLTSPDDSSFEEFYGIYTESIVPSERKTREQIAGMVARHDYRVLLMKRNDRVVGFCILFVPSHESFCLLEYMAVHATHRNLGIGEKLFRHSIQAVASDRGGVPILIEVDSERELVPDQDIRRKRKRFYRRLGCSQIDGLAYLLPLPGQGPPPKMDLMIYLPGSLPPIQKSQSERWLRVIYQGVYNCAPDDPRIAQMMESVADPLKLV